MPDLLSAVQDEFNRIREMITEVKTLLPKRNVSFYFYELILNEADKAIREHDTVALLRLLPELKAME